MDIGSINNYMDQYQSTQQTSKTAGQISKLSQSDLESATDEELMDVCKQFESYFLEQVFKEMEKTTNLFGEEDSGSSSQLVDYFKDSVSSVADGDVLSRHFKKNKKRFQWKEPRFKGVMVIAPNKHLADLAIKVVSRCRNEEAARIVLSRIYGADVTKTIAVCFGIFEKGDDDYIDKKVYGVSSSTESDELFHKAIKGKLCKRPASYSDDEEAVRQDYLARQETEWIQSLRKEYPYSIYWDTIIKNQ